MTISYRQTVASRLIALILCWWAFLAQGQDSPMQFQACSFSTVIDASALGYDPPSHCPVRYWALPSEVASCIASFALDVNNATQHLSSLHNITSEFFVFKDIAIDATASVPSTTPLDYPIYNGSDHGQVNILQALIDFRQEVEATQEAKLDLFFNIYNLYARLYDAHVEGLDQIETGGMLDDISLYLVDPVTNKPIQLRYNEIGEEDAFAPTISVTSSKGKVESKTITQIDNKSPMDFFSELANMPTGGAYKSLGSRVQSVLRNFAVNATFGFGMHNHLKDNYTVSLSDGSAVTWNTWQTIPCPVAQNVGHDEIEQNLTQAGAIYGAAEKAVVDILLIDQLPSAQATSRQQQVDPEETTISKYTNMKQFKTFDSRGRYRDLLGYLVTDDYAVFKIQSFSLFADAARSRVDLTSIPKVWAEMSAEANAKGVTRLIVDVVANSGGTVDLGYQLVSLVYPEAEYEDVINPYDKLYTPSYDVYINHLLPIIDEFNNFVSQDGGTVTAIEFLNSNSTLLVDKLERVKRWYAAMLYIYAHDPTDDDPYMEAEIKKAYLYIEGLNTRVEQRNPPTITQQEFLNTFNLINNSLRFLTSATETHPNVFSFIGVNVTKVLYVRGGVADNYTSPFYLVTESEFVDSQKQVLAMEHPHQFKQFLILADGNGVGSTANTFQSTVTLHSKNKHKNFEIEGEEDWVAPADMVTYGGTGRKEDSAVTQFAGGSVSRVNLKTMYIPEMVLATFAIVAEGSELGDKAEDILEMFDAAVPQPCYYCHEMPRFPTVEVYSTLTGPESIPLEYVNQIPDFYIRQWPFATRFGNDWDLAALYDRASSFFAQQKLSKGSGEGVGWEEADQGDADNSSQGIMRRSRMLFFVTTLLSAALSFIL